MRISDWSSDVCSSDLTEMSEYRRVDGNSGAGDASIEHVKTYRLTPGTAGLYDVGAIHAIDYPDAARVVRVTGTELESVERLKLDTARGRAEVIQRVGVNRGRDSERRGRSGERD